MGGPSNTRRGFLRSSGAAALVAPELLAARQSLIERIERSVIWRGRQGGTVWVQPRACRIPGKPPLVFMTLQAISGSDVYGPVHWSHSGDLGTTWSTPAPIPGMGRRLHADGVEEGICDVVPEHHPKTGTILAMGHNVYYKDNVLTRPNEQRWPVYIVRSADARWSEVRRLEWDNAEASAMYTSNCSQRVTLANGDILVPLSHGPLGRPDRAVSTALCAFDGRRLTIRRTGNQQRLAVRRGLLEPSLVSFGGRYYMTIRAEDDRGYVTTSQDGLQWAEKNPWCWDNGEPLTLSSTQQRWLPHSDSLFLVYTRKAPENVNVIRWRSPLYVAQVDTRKLKLIRDTEQVVFPMSGDGVADPDSVAQVGNFHTTAVTPGFSIVTVGETMHKKGYRGDTLLARLYWRRPNRNVAG